mmetsp:Transcript_72660/g.193831  ORF Transcript_72660/g.193831 Transcript_72660/m.193831 type:complete len:656 (-) Transcript_72660:54-2021(-)
MAFAARAAARGGKTAGLRRLSTSLNLRAPTLDQSPCSPRETSEARLSRVQLQIDRAQLRVPRKWSCSTSQSLEDVIRNPWFATVVHGTIVFNTLQLGAETELGDVEGAAPVFFALEVVVLLVFVVEMVLKLLVLKASYFGDWANNVDIVIVVAGVADVVLTLADDVADLGVLSLMRIIRLVRLLRLVKLVRQFRPFVVILQGIFNAFVYLSWVAGLLAVFLYACSILCVEVIGKAEDGLYSRSGVSDADQDDMEIFNQFNPKVYFGNLFRSAYTLFCISVVAEYSQVGRPLAETQPAMLAFLFVFTFVTTFGIMNVIMGVIVESTLLASKTITDDIQRANLEGQHHRLQRLCDVVFALDVKSDLTQEEFVECLEAHIVVLRGVMGPCPRDSVVHQPSTGASGRVFFDGEKEGARAVDVHVLVQSGRFEARPVQVEGEWRGSPTAVDHIQSLFSDLGLPLDFTPVDVYLLLDADGAGQVNRSRFKLSLHAVSTDSLEHARTYDTMQQNRLFHVVCRLQESLKKALRVAQVLAQSPAASSRTSRGASGISTQDALPALEPRWELPVQRVPDWDLVTLDTGQMEQVQWRSAVREAVKKELPGILRSSLSRFFADAGPPVTARQKFNQAFATVEHLPSSGRVHNVNKSCGGTVIWPEPG